jgi:hypothetical protein
MLALDLSPIHSGVYNIKKVFINDFARIPDRGLFINLYSLNFIEFFHRFSSKFQNAALVL